MNENKSHLIILNGTSSAGKSSIARKLQENQEIYFLHFQMDMFWQMVPADYKENPRKFPTRNRALQDAIKSFLNQGFNIIFDTVTIGSDVADMWEVLKEYDPFIVGVKASLEDITEREKTRGDRDIGIAAGQYPIIHEGVIYDLEVNMSDLTTELAAEKILTAYKAFKRI